MNGRIIAIGDIHGCHAEFSELLDRLELSPDDQLILMGDLINRGPDSTKVIDLARKHRALSLLGNHELRFLTAHRSGNREILKEGDERTYDSLRPEDWTYLEQMVLTHELKQLDIVFVHGGFLPNEPWQKQQANVVTRIQVIDDNGKPRKRGEAPGAPCWADLWVGPPFVIYGHISRPEIYKRKWSVGIDTACVMGGHLTAFILPEKRFVQVKARKKYF